MDEIRPFSTHNNIPVIFGTDRNFLPYVAVALASLAQTAGTAYFYDVFILSGRPLPSAVQKQLLTLIQDKPNISLRFVSLPEKQRLWVDALPVRENYSPVIYYRLLLPALFEQYDKIIYADADVLFLRGAEYLYRQAMPSGSVLAAAADALPYAGEETTRENFTAYTRRIGLQSPFSYINSGVLLWNLKCTREEDSGKKLLQILSSLEKPLFPDQDALNVFFEKKIHFLPLAYNFFALEPDVREPLSPQAVQYMQARKEAAQNPAVIHYAGFVKPWFYPYMPYAAAWWQTAKTTPFYADIRARLHTHDSRMRRRQRLRAFYLAQLYFYKALKRLPLLNVEDKILRLTERKDMTAYWVQNRFKKQKEDV